MAGVNNNVVAGALCHSVEGKCNAAGMVIDYERIVSEFLTGDSMRKVFSHLCNHASGQVTDPI
jgi:hypothetical protein